MSGKWPASAVCQGVNLKPGEQEQHACKCQTVSCPTLFNAVAHIFKIVGAERRLLVLLTKVHVANLAEACSALHGQQATSSLSKLYRQAVQLRVR
jgi:hypothetical protein